MLWKLHQVTSVTNRSELVLKFEAWCATHNFGTRNCSASPTEAAFDRRHNIYNQGQKGLVWCPIGHQLKL